MKKVLTLALALVFVLALAAPAMAFTGDTTAPNPTPYTLKIYLVEYQSEDLFTGWIGLPAADRGYAKNETVAAVVELKVPKGEATLGTNWAPLEISAKNASFKIMNNTLNSTFDECTLRVSNATGHDVFTLTGTDNLKDKTVANNYAADKTYKWLVFAYVTGDDASITAKFAEVNVPILNGSPFKLNGKQFSISFATNTYTLTSIDAPMGVVKLLVDSDNKTTGMTIKPDTLAEAVVVRGNPFEVMIGGNFYGSGSSDSVYVAAKKIYDDVVVKVFGLNFDLRGAYLRDKYFTDLVSNKTLVAKVDIKPWTAYVKVPDNVVVNPPKTGAAASILGFVMVALAGASAVALKKR